MRNSAWRFADLAAVVIVVGGWPAAVDAQASAGLSIVEALYGPINAAHPHDFSVRLQQTCGDRATTCESFCSSALIGLSKAQMRLPLSPRPICRVVYRCGDDVTRATEADNNDTLILSCRQPR